MEEKAGQKIEQQYETYEWQDKSTTDIIDLPKNAHTLAVLTEIASSPGYNSAINGLDANIRYIVEVVESLGDESQEQQIEYWFRSTCGAVVFDVQAKQQVNGKVEYRCPYCQEILAFNVASQGA